jgi:nucleotide-binding universal stress UspA family protein
VREIDVTASIVFQGGHGSDSRTPHYNREMPGLTRTATEVLLIGLVAWLTTGVVLAVVMGRRGHNAFEWFLIGSILGPISLPLAWARINDEPRQDRDVVGAAPGHGAGPLDILVGIDGSDESLAALRAAVEMLGTRVRRLTLANVTDFDHGSPQAEPDRKRALAILEDAAALVSASQPGTILLSGRPADALSAHARGDGYELLVVGRRGRGASKAILGSTASQLTRSTVPVLMV